MTARPPNRRFRTGKPLVGTLLAGTLLAGSLDLAFATTYWRWRAGVAPSRVAQSVAAGVLGPRSVEGGAATAALGVALHYGIMLAMVCVYAYAAARHAPLRRRPWCWGAAYGLLLYTAMTWVVVPLSAATPGPGDALWIGLSVIVHVVVGVVCALAARRALARRASF